jgi:transposase InsO family protein
MALIDRQYLRTPFYGSRRMTAWLQTQGHMVNRKRVQRLMQLMGLEEALSQGRQEIFNTDQGSQFTGDDFIDVLRAHGVAISMDGRGRFSDNIFVERLWRSFKYRGSGVL